MTELTMTENLFHLAGIILVLVKLMVLSIYAKFGFLRPRPSTKSCSRKAKATNFGLKAKAMD